MQPTRRMTLRLSSVISKPIGLSLRSAFGRRDGSPRRSIYVATPALPDTINRGFVGTSLVILGVIVTTGYQRATGVKLLRFRAFELLLFAAALLATLFFFSVSLGLAASGLPWWIVASVVASFAVATGLAHLVAASMQRRVRDAA
jgi:hypothetical protein